jgi:hypothetical protein
VETVRKSGVDAALSAALAPWCKPRAVHDPGKSLLDLALATAVGGDCLADVAMLRGEPTSSGRWPPTRPSPAWSTLSPQRALGHWLRCVPRGPKSANMSGSWPGSMLRTPKGR